MLKLSIELIIIPQSPADTDELTFDEGEKITNVEKPDEGWWLGVCRGRKGIFPASYITIAG